MARGRKKLTARVRRAKLTADSTRDTEWQVEEYARVMGEAKALEQVRAARLEKGLCVCNQRTLKNHGVIRTIHERDCSKWKPWMEEWEAIPDRKWSTPSDE